jgi:predicted nucleic acid-binding protein
VIDTSFDFLGQVETELAESRRTLRRALERTQALAELHSRAVEVQQKLRRPITGRDVFNNPRDEEDRAWLDLLVTRITGEED